MDFLTTKDLRRGVVYTDSLQDGGAIVGHLDRLILVSRLKNLIL